MNTTAIKLSPAAIMGSLLAMGLSILMISCQPEASTETEEGTEQKSNVPDFSTDETTMGEDPIGPPATTVKWDVTTYDFGDVKNGDQPMGAFYFTNTGDEILYVKEADADCGCTKPKFNVKGVPPGGRDSVTVQLRTGRMKAAGPAKRRVNVLMNTIPKDYHELYVTANVIGEGTVDHETGEITDEEPGQKPKTIEVEAVPVEE